MISKPLFLDWLVVSPGETYSELIWLPDSVLETLNSIIYYSKRNPNNEKDLDPVTFWRAEKTIKLKVFPKIVGKVKCSLSTSIT